MSAKSQHKNILIAIAALVCTIAVVALLGYFFLSEEEEVIQGQVEVSEYRVSSKLPGRVLRLNVKEGDFVKAGDVVAILEVPEVDAQQQSASAVEAAANAMSMMADKGAREEQKRGAFEVWQQAKAGLDVAKKSYERVNRLYEQGVMTAQKRDEALAQYKAFEAQEKAAKSQYDMAENGARAEEREAARQQAKAARGNVNLITSLKKETVQRALFDGEVSEIYPKQGELLGTGSPIMTVTMNDDVWGTFNVREDQLNSLKVGDEITAYVPAFDQDIKMRIFFVKDQGSYAVWKASKANMGYDLKTFEVKARPVTTLEGLRPGMSLILKGKSKRLALK